MYMPVQSEITINEMVDKINFRKNNNNKISSKRYNSYKSSSFCIQYLIWDQGWTGNSGGTTPDTSYKRPLVPAHLQGDSNHSTGELLNLHWPFRPQHVWREWCHLPTCNTAKKVSSHLTLVKPEYVITIGTCNFCLYTCSTLDNCRSKIWLYQGVRKSWISLSIISYRL